MTHCSNTETVKDESLGASGYHLFFMLFLVGGPAPSPQQVYAKTVKSDLANQHFKHKNFLYFRYFKVSQT